MFNESVLRLFGVSSALLTIACYVPYVYGIFRHRVKPERASWLIWSVLTVIGFFSNAAIGATNSLWLVGAQGIGVFFVFFLSIKYGYGGLLKRDKYVLGVSLGVLVLWLLTEQPLIAVYLTALMNALGGYLTIVKAYESPKTESASAWTLSGIAGIFGMLSVGKAEWSLLVYPAYIFIFNGGVVVAIILSTLKGRRLSTTVSK